MDNLKPNVDDLQRRRLYKYRMEQSSTDHLRYFFKKRTSGPLILSQHHMVVAWALAEVVKGNITRLIINEPPRFTKTEQVVIGWIAHCLAVEPRCRFVHLSYSKPLALTNSSAVRETINLPEHQELWPMTMKPDADAKERWNTDKQGGMYSTAAGGQVTGFGAGLMEPGFYGAVVIDDPIKPDDARYQLKRTQVNERFMTTIHSRKALTTTPIIVNMQRIHDDDLCGHLLRGGSGEMWHHLELPALIDNERKYPKEYTHGIPIDHGLPDGPLWEYKLDLEGIEALKNGHIFTYCAQYDQRPKIVEGAVFNEEDWEYYDPDVPMTYEYMGIYADTAQEVKKAHDWSVFQLWGKKGPNIYLLDQIRGKWQAGELKNKARQFVEKHIKPSATYSQLRHMKIENKSSGTGLIQELNNGNPITGELPLPIPVLKINPSSDKLSRAMDAQPFIAAGRVFLPRRAPWLLDFIDEFNHFSADDSHGHDDQVDPTGYAIMDMLGSTIKVGSF